MRLVLLLAAMGMNYGVGCECAPRRAPSSPDAGVALALRIPVGGEVWAGRQLRTLTWEGNEGPVTVEFSLDTGGTWTTIATALDATTLDWLVPAADSETCLVRVTDGAGRIATSSVFTIDSTAPTVQFLAPDAGVLLRPGEVTAVQWTASDRALAPLPITIELSSNAGSTWTVLSQAEPNDGAFGWMVSLPEASRARLQVSAVDLAGNIGTASSGDFTIDGAPPVFTPGTFRINGGATSTSNLFVRVDFEARDDGSPVSAFCLKYDDPAQPASTDPCWQSVTPVALLAGSVDFRLGFAPRAYPVFGWARNVSGLTSSLSNGGTGVAGTDSATITFAPLQPPDVTRVTASPTPSGNALTIPAGNTVYVRWRATTSGAFGPTPISVFFTTDDVTFTQVAAGLPNAAGPGCSLTAGDTGCYAWTNASPTSSYFRVRVGAVDTNARQTFRSTPPLNVASTLQILAGSTDPGTGGSAEAAVFITQNVDSVYGFPQSFLVSEAGVVYFNDAFRGLLVVDPLDGVQRLVLPRTGVITDGPVPGATLGQPVRLTFDSQGRVLIFDANVIRRFDPVAHTVETILGGGTDATSPVVAPRDLSISSAGGNVANLLLFATSDGKIYFQASGYFGRLDAGYTLRVYDPAANAGAGEVRTLAFSGRGDGLSATQDITTCEGYAMGATWDLASGALTRIVLGLGHRTATCTDTQNGTYFSVISPTTLQPIAPHPPDYDDSLGLTVGGDGALYRFSRRTNVIHRFDVATQTFTLIAGTGINGTCPDGSAALSCDLDVADVWATRSGRLYFLDRGRIRTIDQAGNVYTLSGTTLAAGDGAEATFARIGSPFDVKLWNNAGTDTVVFVDGTQFRIREFPVGGFIHTVAGNGSDGVPDLVAPALAQPISYNQNGTINDIYLQVHPTTGTLFTSREGPYLSKIDRQTGLWSDLAGGGTVNYFSAAAQNALGPTIDFTDSYSPKAVGFDGANTLLFHKMRYVNSRYEDAFLKRFDLSTNRMVTLAGVGGVASTTMSPDGTPAATARVSYDTVGANWDAVGNRWLLFNPNEPNVIRALPVGGTLTTVATLGTDVLSFALRRTATVHRLYLCRDTGELAVFDVATNTETALPWPITRMQCTGRNLVYSATRGSVLFPFTLDGVGGIGEYFTP